MSMKFKFVVLVGSVARGDATRRSDVDIVEIGEPFNWTPGLAMGFGGKCISKVKYTAKRFRQLYAQGSLFLYHVFMEGQLLVGEANSWTKLRKDFVVKKKFTREISRSRAVLDFLISDEQNASAPIAFLSNALRGLKQIAIYRLAESGRYVFDKREAIREFHSWIPGRLLDAMLEAEYIISRGGVKRSSKIDFNSSADELLRLCLAHRKELA